MLTVDTVTNHFITISAQSSFSQLNHQARLIVQSYIIISDEVCDIIFEFYLCVAMYVSVELWALPKVFCDLEKQLFGLGGTDIPC